MLLHIRCPRGETRPPTTCCSYSAFSRQCVGMDVLIDQAVPDPDSCQCWQSRVTAATVAYKGCTEKWVLHGLKLASYWAPSLLASGACCDYSQPQGLATSLIGSSKKKLYCTDFLAGAGAQGPHAHMLHRHPRPGRSSLDRWPHQVLDILCQQEPWCNLAAHFLQDEASSPCLLLLHRLPVKTR